MKRGEGMKILRLTGIPSEKQKQFFASRALYTAYGGARGGGKSWALRRKLILMCLRYPGITCLIIRRSYPELRQNHILPLQEELGDFVSYSDRDKCFLFPGGSRIFLGYLSSDRDILRYQGQEYDVIAVDEATQLGENRFQSLKACLRGTGSYPKRMYLTCNPGGVGHAWVKRLFVDREFLPDERPEEYAFIQARVYDNEVLLRDCPAYLESLRSLPPLLRKAWLEGSWAVFEGQFFPELREDTHRCPPRRGREEGCRYFAGLDYGFDMLAVVIFAVDGEGGIAAVRELAIPGLTLSEAAAQTAALCRGLPVEYIAAGPDLWNRRQDTGYSGIEIMQRIPSLPPLVRADNRRVEGWRAVREALRATENRPPLRISEDCAELWRCLTALTVSGSDPEDAASRPHEITHLPEALRYGIMSRMRPLPERADENSLYERFFGHPLPAAKPRGIYDF